MKDCYVLHGFNKHNNYLKNLIDELEKSQMYNVIPINYRWLSLIGVGICNDNLASLLASVVKPNSIGIGHSNGATILHMSTHMGARFNHLVYINAALDKDKVPANHVNHIDVWYSNKDIATRFASLLPFSPWGSMGAYGYVGDDKRFDNHLHNFNHSGIFENRIAIVKMLNHLKRRSM